MIRRSQHPVEQARLHQREQDTLRAEELRNARELARDAMLYGTTFVDVTGRRIDPTAILPPPKASSDQGYD